MIKPILHLNLKRKWFDMILCGEKKEEYRKQSRYWRRIFGTYIRIKGRNYHPSDVIICFSNGYQKKRRQIFVDCINMGLGYGKQKWGAEKNEQCFVLIFGKVKGGL